jgi:hypothetical protein
LSPIATGNRLDRAIRKKIPKVAQTTGTVDVRFCSAFRHLGTDSAESFLVSKYSWTINTTRSREMSSSLAIDLAEIRPAVFQD